MERSENVFEQALHWEVTITPDLYNELSTDPKWVPVMENCIYSKNGNWGVLFSHESHALIGGSEKFIELLQKGIPSIDDQIEEFLNEWKYNRDHYESSIEWVPRLLTHLYGPEKAATYLKKVNL
jgi:hypothetical protein